MKANKENYAAQIEKMVTDPAFIKLAANMAKQLGVSAEVWNNNRMMFLLNFASEIVTRKNAK